MAPQPAVPFDFLAALSLPELLCVSVRSNSAWGRDAAAAEDPHGVRGAQRCPAEARGEHACRCGAAGRRRDSGEGAKRPPPPASGDAAPGTHFQLLLPASARWEPVAHWSVAKFPQHHNRVSLVTVSGYKRFKARNTLLWLEFAGQPMAPSSFEYYVNRRNALFLFTLVLCACRSCAPVSHPLQFSHTCLF